MLLLLLLACEDPDPVGSLSYELPFAATELGAQPVFVLTRDQGGRVREQVGEAALCPDRSVHAGGLGFGAVCLGSEVGVAVEMTRSVEGFTAFELSDPALVCPGGFRHVGGRGRSEVCVREEPGVAVRLTRDAAGRPLHRIPAPGDVCPDGFRHVGGEEAGEVCHRDGPGHAVVLSHGTSGDTAVALGDGALLCPGGFTFVGWQDVAAVCVTDAPVSSVALTRSFDGLVHRGVASEPALCPPGFEGVGGLEQVAPYGPDRVGPGLDDDERSGTGVERPASGSAGHAVCLASRPWSVLALSRDVAGRSFLDLRREDDVCPDNAVHVGGDGFSVVCVGG